MDTCFANLKELFGTAYPYSYDIEDLASRCQRLLAPDGALASPVTRAGSFDGVRRWWRGRPVARRGARSCGCRGNPMRRDREHPALYPPPVPHMSEPCISATSLAEAVRTAACAVARFGLTRSGGRHQTQAGSAPRHTASGARARWRRRRQRRDGRASRRGRRLPGPRRLRPVPARRPARAAPLILCAWRVSAGEVAGGARGVEFGQVLRGAGEEIVEQRARSRRAIAAGERIERGRSSAGGCSSCGSAARVRRRVRRRRAAAPATVCGSQRCRQSRPAPGCRPAWPGSRPCRRPGSARPRLSAPTRSARRSACARGRRALPRRGSCAPAGSRPAPACARRDSTSA